MVRSFVAGVLLLALIGTVALANTAVWATRTVLDESTFVATFTRALETPAAERAVARRLAEELVAAAVEADDRVRLVLGPIVGEGIAASDDDLVDGLEPPITLALDHPRAEAARAALLGAVHEALVEGSSAAGPVRILGDAVVLDVRDLLEAVVAALDPRLQTVAAPIVALARTEFTLASTPWLGTTAGQIDELGRTAVILPLLALAIGLLAVVAAHRRRRAVVWVGIAIALGGAAGLAFVTLGRLPLADADPVLDGGLLGSTYDAVRAGLVTQSLMVLVAGLALALLAGAAASLPSRRSPRTVGAADPW